MQPFPKGALAAGTSARTFGMAQDTAGQIVQKVFRTAMQAPGAGEAETVGKAR